MEPIPCHRWRNSSSRRLGVLPSPNIDIEPSHHIQPGAEFSVSRVAVIGGRRYLQLVDGRGWVPECSRKDSSRIVVEPSESTSTPQPHGRHEESSVQASTWPYPCTELQLRYLRVTVLATRSPKTVSMQLGRICLRAGGELIDLKDFAVEAIDGRSPAREGPEKVLTTKGKWLDLSFRENDQSILMISAPSVFKVDDIAFQTANDQPTRDPIDIRVDASRDGWEWVPVHIMGGDEGSALYMPIARLAWTPWFQLRVDEKTVGSLIAEAEAASCAQTQLPPELSWWSNIDRRLGIAKDPRLTSHPVDYVAEGATFAAIHVVAREGRHFLQLPENRGWVPTSASMDATHQVLHQIGWQHAPTEIVKRLQDVSRNRSLSPMGSRECESVGVTHLRMIVLATRTSNVVSIQLSQVALRCDGKLLHLDSVTAENPRGQCPASEGPEKVLRPTGKWLDMNFISNQQSELLLVFQRETQVEEFAFCTCSDMENRDPVKFRIDGSRNGKDWFVLQESAGNFPTPIARRTWTPWILLRYSKPAPTAWKSMECFSTLRHRCPVAACADAFSRTEGYLLQGMLLKHMLRKHPNAKETEEVKRSMKKGKSATHSGRGAFAKRTFMKSKEVVQKMRKVKAQASKVRPVEGAEESLPRTPEKKDQRGSKRSIEAVSNTDKLTPPPHLANSVAAIAESPRLVRLSDVAEVAIGSRVDVEAEVHSVSACKRRQLRQGAPSSFISMRRFGLCDGAATCWWVLSGKRAESFPETVVGHRIKIFGTKVFSFQRGRHFKYLGGCSACHQVLI